MYGRAERLKVSDITTKDSLLKHDCIIQVDKNPNDSNIIGKKVTIERFIHAGGGGSVFKARNTRNGKLYAVKVFPPNQARFELYILNSERMKAEHPGKDHVVRLFATSTIYSPFGPNRMVAFLEFYDGGDLSELIERVCQHRQDVPEPFVWKIMHELLLACEFLTDENLLLPPPGSSPQNGTTTPFSTHSYLGNLTAFSAPKSPIPILLHRDLKPDNILLRWPTSDPTHKYYPTAMLTDFGLALELPPGQTKCPQTPGLPAWNAPEPFSSPRSDTWAIGAIIHGLCHRGVPPIRFRVNNPFHVATNPFHPINDRQHAPDFYDNKCRKQVRPLVKHGWSTGLDGVVRKLCTEHIKYRMEPKEARKWVESKILEEGWGTGERFVELPVWAAKRGVFEEMDLGPEKLVREVDVDAMDVDGQGDL